MSQVEFNPNITIEEVGERLLKEHLERCKKKISRFKELHKEKNDIAALHAFEELNFKFDTFIGDINYLFHKCSQSGLQKVAFNAIHRVGQELEFAIKIGDDLKAFYEMERLVQYLGYFIEDIESAPKESRKDKPVSLFISCCKSEEPHECKEERELV